MNTFEDKYLENLKFGAQSLSNLRALGEYKGKEQLYMRQSADTLDKLLESAIIESAESSNRIEGINVEHKIVENIVKSNATPKNRSEQEVAGYRDVLNLIHQSHEDIPLNENVILQFHSMLYRHSTKKAGFWKKSDNEIVDKKSDGTKVIRFKPTPAAHTPKVMNELIGSYNAKIDSEELDALILIPMFVFDFLCVHPFSDGNGRIGRLLTLLLLYRSEYRVGKYVSLERIIETSKESYYDALIASSQKWHQSKHDILPWLNYFHGTLLAAYKEFESRVGIFKGKGSKTEQVKNVIRQFVKPFSIVDVEDLCPNVSRDMIRKVLRELRDERVITTTSKGRGALWEKSR